MTKTSHSIKGQTHEEVPKYEIDISMVSPVVSSLGLGAEVGMCIIYHRMLQEVHISMGGAYYLP